MGQYEKGSEEEKPRRLGRPARGQRGKRFIPRRLGRGPKFCGLHSLGGRVETPEGPRYRTLRLRCKSWGCPQCAAKRAWRLKRSIIQQAEEHGLDRFLTLTMDPSKGSPEESWPQIKAVWKKFQTSLARKLGKGVKFLWVIEAQKSGYAHLHILLDRYVPQAWISKSWDRLGGGRIVFIMKTDVRKTGVYLAKYLAKGFDGALAPGQRRYGSSREVHLGTPKGKAKGVWVRVQAGLEILRERVAEAVLGEWKGEDGRLEGFESWDPPVYFPGNGAWGTT